MPSVGGVDLEMLSPVEKAQYKKYRRMARKATVFPIALDVIIVVASLLFYYNLTPEFQGKLTAQITSGVVTGAKLLLLLIDMRVKKLIRKSSSKRVAQGYRINRIHIITLAVLTVLEFIVFAFLASSTKETTGFWLIVSGTAIIMIQFGYIIALHAMGELVLEPLKDILETCEKKNITLVATIPLAPPKLPSEPNSGCAQQLDPAFF